MSDPKLPDRFVELLQERDRLAVALADALAIIEQLGESSPSSLLKEYVEAQGWADVVQQAMSDPWWEEPTERLRAVLKQTRDAGASTKIVTFDEGIGVAEELRRNKKG